VRVVVVVVLNLASDHSENGLGIWQRRHLDVVALQRLHEGHRDAVALRALDRREAGLQVKLAGEDLRVLRDVRRAIIYQHLDDRRCAVCAEAAFDSFEQDVANLGTTDPGIDHRAPGDDFAVMGIDDEGAADDVAVPAGELEPVVAPAQVRARDDYLAVVNMLGTFRIFPGEQRM